ncbi:MAG: ATP-binding protein, partial [Rhizobiaceae bacterium]
MIEKILIRSTEISNNTLSNLDGRDVALWVHDLPVESGLRESLLAFLQLPWRLVMFDNQDKDLIAELEASSNINDPLIRKRGFIQIIDVDPSRIELPARCLPVYLLRGRLPTINNSSFENRLRRMTMLEEFRRSGSRELVVLSGDQLGILSDLEELWSAGFRTQLTFISDSVLIESKVEDWVEQNNVALATFIQQPWQQVVQDILVRYWETYPVDRHIIRMRNTRGQIHKIDITDADEIERPILDLYTPIEERDLTPLVPRELSQEEFISFFKNPEQSWRPYAAGLPWLRDTNCKEKLRKYLHRLDSVGPDENCVAYVTSEPGAGGTTLVRALAWEYAREGYPVIVAKPYPFAPESLPLVNYLTRVHQSFTEQTSGEFAHSDEKSEKNQHLTNRLYETPWIIVFDTVHWQHRDAELLQFRNDLTRSGRPVCLLIVTGTVLGLPFRSATFKKIAELNHAIELDEARELGRHLNEFLRYYGRSRTQAQWEKFYDEHTVRYLEGTAAFWVTLSFWLQGQYDLSESIQQWIYKSFQEQADNHNVQDALLQIAAMSSERLPLPQTLLPPASGQWPVWYLIEDRAESLSKLGLTQITAQGERYWALVHDILGRLLINGLFHDYSTRDKMGFSSATDSEHLRFLILSKISKNSRLG